MLCIRTYLIQFICENGRKLLSLRYFAYNRNQCSETFKDCTTATQFIDLMATVAELKEIESDTEEGKTTFKQVHKQREFIILSLIYLL